MSTENPNTSEQPTQPEGPSKDEKGSGIIDKIQELGQTNVPDMGASNIHCMTVIGQIEGHMQLPPQNKTTKYEHILPQLVAVEQNAKVEACSSS